MEAKDLGRRLAQIRQESNCSQAQLAYQVEYHGIPCTQQQVGYWEKVGNIRAIELATVAVVLNRPVAEFYKPPTSEAKSVFDLRF